MDIPSAATCKNHWSGIVADIEESNIGSIIRQRQHPILTGAAGPAGLLDSLEQRSI
jgi:hypothetical protein